MRRLETDAEEVTAEINLTWDPDEISQVVHEEEALNNPLAPIVRSFNELGRSAVKLTESATTWAEEMRELYEIIEELDKMLATEDIVVDK